MTFSNLHKVAPGEGFEPPTLRLTAAYYSTKLTGNILFIYNYYSTVSKLSCQHNFVNVGNISYSPHQLAVTTKPVERSIFE